MTSMEKMGEYSVVCAVQNMWLMTRVFGIGLGWIIILDEKKLLKSINASKTDKLITYLSLSYVSGFKDEPELRTINWEKKKHLTH